MRRRRERTRTPSLELSDRRRSQSVPWVVSPSSADPRPLARARRFDAVMRLRAMVTALEDRRFFNPLGPARAPISLGPQRRFRPAVTYSSSPGVIPIGIGFARPNTVGICVRRKVRREVLFAKNKSGGRHRRPRRNYWSSVKC